MTIHTYSYSKLKDFNQCPLKFRFKYLEQIDTHGFETIEIFRGHCVHETLADLYDSLRNGNLFSLDDLLHSYNERWRHNWHANVHVVRGRPQEHFDNGMADLARYYKAHYPFDDSRTEALEETVRFEISLDSWWAKRGSREFYGKVDRLTSRSHGLYEIHDYKTGKYRRDGLAENWRQLTLYQCAIQYEHPEVREVELVLHYLQTGETFRQRQSLHGANEIVSETKREIINIESQVSFHPRQSVLCQWCEFRECCPAFS